MGTVLALAPTVGPATTLLQLHTLRLRTRRNRLIVLGEPISRLGGSLIPLSDGRRHTRYRARVMLGLGGAPVLSAQQGGEVTVSSADG